MRWLGIGLAVVALALPGVAIAETMTPGGGADTWTFYGYGNGYALAQILEAIKRMTDPASNPGFRNLTLVLAMAGFLAMCFTGILAGTLQKIAMYFAGMLLTVYMLFSLKVDIFVEDMVWDGTGSPQFTQRIDGVPAAIGLPAVVISEIGMWATSSIEANFTTPNFANLRLSEGAPVGMAANMLNDMKNIRLTDPYLRSSIQSFMNDCALPNIFNGSISPVTLITSQNAWSVLGSNLNPAVYTVVYDSSDPNGGMEACDTAYTKIDNRLQTAAPSLLNGMGESSPFWLQQAAGSTALSEAALEDSFRWASGGSVVQDATGLATQAAIAEMYSGTYEYAAMATGSSELISALNIEQARRAQQSGWYSTAILFRDMAGYFFAILQAFVIGLAPIVFAAILVPGLGRKMGTSYAQVMTWLIMWWPGLAIVNYIMMLYFQGQTTGYLADGLTMANMGAVSEMSDKMVMASGFMSTLVPAIMWGLVSGSGYAFTSVLDRASGSQHAAAAAGSISTGAATAGQVSMNNASMNAHQTSHRYSSGNEVSAHHVGVGASQVTNMSGQDMNVGLRAADFRESMSASQGYTEATQRTQEAKEAFTQQTQSMMTDTFRGATQYAEDQGYVRDGNIDWSRMSQDTQGQRYMEELAATRSLMENAGVSEREMAEITQRSSTTAAAEVGARVQGGLSLNSGVSAYGQGSVRGETGRSSSDSEQATREEGNSISQSDSGRLTFAEDGALSVTGSDGERYSVKYNEGEARQVLESRAGEDRASMLYAASTDYQEAVQAQQKAHEEWTASRSGSLPTPANPQVVSDMQTDMSNLRGRVGQTMEEDQADIDGQRGDVVGAVGANTSDVGARAGDAAATTAPVRDRGVSDLSVDTGAQLDNIQGAAQAPVERPNDYHVVDNGDAISVVDRRDIAAADQANADALITGGQRSNIQVGDDTFVPTFYTQDESGQAQAVYAVEREGGHSYYQYGGDGTFEPVDVAVPPTQDQIDQQAQTGPTVQSTEANLTRWQLRDDQPASESQAGNDQPEGSAVDQAPSDTPGIAPGPQNGQQAAGSGQEPAAATQGGQVPQAPSYGAETGQEPAAATQGGQVPQAPSYGAETGQEPAAATQDGQVPQAPSYGAETGQEPAAATQDGQVPQAPSYGAETGQEPAAATQDGQVPQAPSYGADPGLTAYSALS
ncbi:conjugal transfer protein TraG N-terminal domain-containing protein [Vreelandella aquamarina]|uniref:Conjugal transfer mating pair stabilization protein TraG n=1 Tax=Vreelandella aquamarina TaxID=77097 RepID=A0A1N6EK64_9GAMM|nr:conjugal transfer protein TraG N-terminal domain-containing protein [Halomonas meridiana]SIN83311.1 conjugal transfer mating pair stabilization protein TraG [Halomonas meridiana]SIN85876.1 conjugal transfer mating pair stabilization protein TraG [Halomonas meridiana]SIN86670.1 conjugal transfer mating pair stabilization protein TraG [Halomonas meridiana]SIO50625.1 conjugal transfer mating pair stabilization protein TraG [Halomonas meridiana]